MHYQANYRVTKNGIPQLSSRSKCHTRVQAHRQTETHTHTHTHTHVFE